MSEKLQSITRRNWEEYDLSEDAHLDRFSLEFEAERQAGLTDKWLNLLEQAQQISSEKKRTLKYTEAKLFLEAKQGGMAGIIKGGKSPTDAEAKAWVQIQPAYVKAVEETDDADVTLMKMQHARDVMSDKKYQIRTLSELWICGYFSKPYISSKVNSQEQDDIRAATKEKLQQSMQKRTRREAEEHQNGI